MKVERLLIIILGLTFASTVWSQSMTFISGNTEPGVVKKLTPDGVVFMRMMKKQFDATDDAFTAKSIRFSIEKIPYENVKQINGVPISAYRVLYRHNPLYRMIERIKFQWTTSMGKGSFVGQAKTLFLFLMLLGVLVPLMVWGGSRLTGGKMGFMVSVLVSVVIYAIGYGLVKGFEAMTVHGVGFMQRGGGQMGATIGLMLLAGLLIGMVTKESIISGLGMIVGWFAGIYAAMWIITMV